MKQRSFLLALSLAALVVGGCSSSVNSGSTTSTTTTGGGGQGGSGGGGDGGSGGGACFVPTERLSLSLLAGTTCNTQYPTNMGALVFEGAFEPISGGFRVAKGADKVEITEAEPAIPAGTFVRLTYGCQSGFYGDSGAFVVLENLATLDGAPNPTEEGTRLWFVVAAGGEAGIPQAIPFKLSFVDDCKVGDFESGSKTPEKLVIEGQGFSVTVDPGKSADFVETTGPEKGSYHAENIDIVFVGFGGGDATTNANYRITRGD
jgi:hypothetical protein